MPHSDRELLAARKPRAVTIRAVLTQHRLEEAEMAGPWNRDGNAIATGDFLGTTNSFALSIRTNDTERVHIGTDGNVGIGTATPATRLHVVGNRLRLESGDRMLLLRSDGADVDVQSDTSNLFIHSSGPGGRNNVVINPFGNEGNVGIGTGTPGAKLEVAGDIRANDVFLTSDARLKSDVVPINGAIGKLSRIRGVSFRRLDDSSDHSTAPRHLGVIAQDVEQVFPELVNSRSGSGHKAVDCGGLVAVVIEAFKELMEQNADLRHRMERLEKPRTSSG